MPEINRNFNLRITPEQFLDACSPTELHEIYTLLESNRYQKRMYPDPDAPSVHPLIEEDNG